MQDKVLHSSSDKAIKYTARLVTNQSSEEGRIFRITWYPATQDMSVYEPVQRNSGVIGGTWQKRSQTFNEKTGEYFKGEDLYVGAEIIIKRHRLVITDIDEASVKRYEEDSNSSVSSSCETFTCLL